MMSKGTKTMKSRASLLFAPGIAFMNRLKYAQKFALIGVLLITPIIILLYMKYESATEDISLIRQKESGLDYIQELNHFVIDVDTHRTLISRMIQQDEEAKAELTENEKSLDERVAALDKLANQQGTDLKTVSKWTELKKEWEDLKARRANLSADDNISLHNSVLTDTRAIVTQILNTAHLVLDSDLDSYYTMDTAFKQLPQLIDRIGRARALAATYAGIKTPDEADKNAVTTLLGQIDTNLDTAKTNIDNVAIANSDLSNSQQEQWQKQKTSVDQLVEYLNKNILNQAQITKSVKSVSEDLLPYVELARQNYEQLTTAYSDLLQTKADALRQQQVNQLIFMLISVLVVIYLFISFYSSVKRAVAELEETAALVAMGDLTSRANLKTRDELSAVAASFNRMTDAYREAILTSRQTSERVVQSAVTLAQNASSSTESSNRITGAIQEVAAGAQSQLKGAEETSKSMDEMAIGIQRIAETSSSVSEAAAAAEEFARSGNDVVRQTIGQMNQIHEKTQESAQIMVELGAQSQEIGSIISVISEIAAQTNLLSLNASIEAARAGEHGAGFMVVASEVKKLAEQTKSAASQISEIVTVVQNQTSIAMSAINSGVTEVGRGMEMMEQTGSIFDQIMTSVRNVAEQIQEVSSAAEEMSAGTEQVTASMEEIVGISRTSAHNAEQMATESQQQLDVIRSISESAGTLNDAAQELKDVIHRYKL
ncbi:HAMP domain-containing protein [Cohnella sp. CFH 77786]|uniref:methyl-accepting chemotaxis protein n=1 Tax=Cohnella sp. CFH 77786 TaxID=2662265 RepID=UPI001C60AB8C|nr:methyl-accepting chemotaxis protein [Cohnella sp. CFH 77786]MBW5446449.1 HAMP domain-containing protein [Cohnella sp. CFH 77786]